MRPLRHLCGIGLALVSLACRDERQATVAPPPTTPFYLTVSDESPSAGSTITVTANMAAGQGMKALGSFAGHLRYNPSGLTFVAESKLLTGLRAFNPQPGDIRVAGAAAEGFEDGRLFAVSFKVNDPGALASIELTLDEVHGTDFANQLPMDPRLRSAHVVRPRQ